MHAYHQIYLVYTYIHKYQLYIHTYIHTYIYTYKHTCISPHISSIYIHAYISTRGCNTATIWIQCKHSMIYFHYIDLICIHIYIYIYIYINRAHDAWLQDSDPPCAILATRSNAAPEWFVSASRLFAPVTHSQKSSIKGLFLTLFRSLFDTF